MMEYRFLARTEIVVTREPASVLEAAVYARRVGVVSTRTVLTLPECQSLLSSARNSAESISVVGQARPNPTVEDAEESVARARSSRCDLILAIGGGSAIDAAKAIRASLVTEQTVDNLFTRGTLTSGVAESKVRLIVVPSAFGTGAESSAGAILTRLADGTKGGIRGRSIPPDLAIISTGMAMHLPAKKCVEIGFDALTHAVETYLSRAATPITDALALDALDRLPSLLVELADEPGDEALLAQLARFSFQLGFNLANASTCLPHRMQYAVASFASAGHQLDLAALYPAWLRALEANKVGRLPRALRGIRATLESGGGRTETSAAPDATFRAFLDRIGVRAHLTDLGLNVSDASILAARTTGNVSLDPLVPDRGTIERVFSDALSPADR